MGDHFGIILSPGGPLGEPFGPLGGVWVDLGDILGRAGASGSGFGSLLGWLLDHFGPKNRQKWPKMLRFCDAVVWCHIF